MNEATPNNEEVDARLASLAQFGFPKNAMAEFLAEHEGGARESGSNGSNSGVKRLLCWMSDFGGSSRVVVSTMACVRFTPG